MIIRLHLIFNIIVLPFAGVYANGGPAKSSAIMSVGEVKLENASEVLLIREDLHFIVIDDSVKINVRYRLKNTSTGKKAITYAFPIDAQIKIFDNDPGLPSDINITYVNALLNYHIISEKINIDSINEEYTLRRWLISSFTINGSSIEELTISYTVQSGFADNLDNTSYVPEYGPRSMIWDFSPASYWGNGIIDTMNITVDVHSIKMKGGSVKLKGIEFVNNNGLYIFSKNSFYPKSKFTITYEYTTFLRNHGMMSKRVDVRSAVKIVTSSHLNSKYSSEKLFDNDMSTAWVEGSLGFGSEDYIDITFNKPVTFTYMTLVPGYTKSKKTYHENNRIKSATVVAYYSDGDSVIEELVFNDNAYCTELPAHVNLINSTPDEKIHSIAMISSFTAPDMPNPDYVTKMRVLINDVFRGSKFNDTAIREIMFFFVFPG